MENSIEGVLTRREQAMKLVKHLEETAKERKRIIKSAVKPARKVRS